jgi:hypothetical protein
MKLRLLIVDAVGLAPAEKDGVSLSPSAPSAFVLAAYDFINVS